MLSWIQSHSHVHICSDRHLASHWPFYQFSQQIPFCWPNLLYIFKSITYKMSYLQRMANQILTLIFVAVYASQVCPCIILICKCRSLLKATMILLPIMGFTWAFGLLAVNQESSVFAWIFAILNSLQVS